MATLSLEQHEQIRELAYQRFIARGCEDSHNVEDWLIAEQEVLNDSNVESSSEWDVMEPFEEELLIGDQLEETMGYRVG